MTAGDWKDLYAAATSGDLELVRHHLAHGVDVDHVHPEYQCTVLVGSILNDHEDVALALLEAGADPEHYSELDDLTPAQAARQRRLPGVLDRLTALGAADATDLVAGARSVDNRTARRPWWRFPGGVTAHPPRRPRS